jgi:hypothetical protein
MVSAVVYRRISAVFCRPWAGYGAVASVVGSPVSVMDPSRVSQRRLLELALMNFLGRGFPMPAAVASIHSVRLLEPFISGVISGLLSTPCTGRCLGFHADATPVHDCRRFRRDRSGARLAPYSLDSSPFPAQGSRPQPRAGAWSHVVRQSFGWILVGAALFLYAELLAFGVGNASLDRIRHRLAYMGGHFDKMTKLSSDGHDTHRVSKRQCFCPDKLPSRSGDYHAQNNSRCPGFSLDIGFQCSIRALHRR